jgi:hypothetical protein
MAVRARVPQKLQMKKPALGQIVPRARPVPRGLLARWFLRSVESKINKAAIEARGASAKPLLKAQKAPAKPVYKKAIFSGNAKPVAAQKPVKRRAA